MAIATDVCTFNAVTLLEKYVRLGWGELTKDYNKRVAKEYSVSPDNAIDADFMAIVGKLREYIVKKSYDCNTLNQPSGSLQKMAVNGSTNATSDYDVTLMGPGAHVTMWRMFNDFLRTYKNVLASAFDVNLYTTGIFLYPDMTTTGLPIVKFVYPDADGKVLPAFTFTPRSAAQRDSMITWAAIKFLHADRMFPDKRTHSAANERNHRLQELKAIATKLVSHKHKFPVKSLAGISDFVAMYALQYLFADQLSRKMYSDHVSGHDESPFLQDLAGRLVYLKKMAEEDVMDVLSHVRYFSVEGAYTQGTVNAVVIQGQADIRVKLDLCDHMCSLIENAGDFMIHAKTAISQSDDLGHFALKCSKYVRRMLEAAQMLKLGDDVSKLKTTFEKHVYNKRSSGMPDASVISLKMYTLASVGRQASSIQELSDTVYALFIALWARIRKTKKRHL